MQRPECPKPPSTGCITRRGEGRTAVPVPVVRVEPTGAQTHVLFDFAGEQITAVVDGGGALASGSGSDVQVLVPEGALPAVLRAVSQDDDLVLVPVPGAGGGA